MCAPCDDYNRQPRKRWKQERSRTGSRGWKVREINGDIFVDSGMAWMRLVDMSDEQESGGRDAQNDKWSF